MKIRNVNNMIIRKHLRLDARNLKRANKFVKSKKCTSEQLHLYRISIPLNKWLINLSKKYLLQI